MPVATNNQRHAAWVKQTNLQHDNHKLHDLLTRVITRFCSSFALCGPIEWRWLHAFHRETGRPDISHANEAICSHFQKPGISISPTAQDMSIGSTCDMQQLALEENRCRCGSGSKLLEMCRRSLSHSLAGISVLEHRSCCCRGSESRPLGKLGYLSPAILDFTTHLCSSRFERWLFLTDFHPLQPTSPASSAFEARLSTSCCFLSSSSLCRQPWRAQIPSEFVRLVAQHRLQPSPMTSFHLSRRRGPLSLPRRR